MSDLTIKLIEHQSQVQDYEYVDILGYIPSLSFFICQPYEEDAQESLKIEEKEMGDTESIFKIEYCQSEESTIRNSFGSDSESFEPSSEMMEESIFSKPSKTSSEKKPRKGAQKKAKGYPTKNFLPNFKGPHLQFLENHLGFEYVNSFQLVKTIKKKNGISLLDYENLYKVEQFQDAFKAFFKRKVLYHELMLSRSCHDAKLIHSRKLYVFQRAFIKKSFKKIN